MPKPLFILVTGNPYRHLHNLARNREIAAILLANTWFPAPTMSRFLILNSFADRRRIRRLLRIDIVMSKSRRSGPVLVATPALNCLNSAPGRPVFDTNCASTQVPVSDSSSDVALPVSTPLCFSSRLMTRVWGGRALGDVLGHTLPTDEPYGEAWDICDLPGHSSQIAHGPLCGRSLSELWTHHRRELAGDSSATFQEFPLLIKWLECRDWLSVQVHPDDEMARRVLNQPQGKSEAWVVIEAEPSALILSGFRPGVTREDVLHHLHVGTLPECLHVVKPRSGDCLVFPAGTVHAAGGGLLVAEIQQSSDATFRLFDWNRSGLDGRPRPLQIEEGLQAIDWTGGAVEPMRPESTAIQAGVQREALVRLPQFAVDRYTLSAPWTLSNTEMTIWMVVEGRAKLTHPDSGEERVLVRGRTALLPAAAGAAVWTPLEEKPVTLLCVTGLVHRPMANLEAADRSS